MPVLTVFAGPNGSGKSSLIRLVDFEGRGNLLDPDAIAKRLDPALPPGAAISAARRILPLVHEALVYDNSREEPKHILTMRMGKVANIASEMPAWAAMLVEGTG